MAYEPGSSSKGDRGVVYESESHNEGGRGIAYKAIRASEGGSGVAYESVSLSEGASGVAFLSEKDRSVEERGVVSVPSSSKKGAWPLVFLGLVKWERSLCL